MKVIKCKRDSILKAFLIFTAIILSSPILWAGKDGNNDLNFMIEDIFSEIKGSPYHIYFDKPVLEKSVYCYNDETAKMKSDAEKCKKLNSSFN